MAMVSALLLCAHSVHASVTCKVPASLQGQDVLAVVSAGYSPDNPMSGDTYRLRFDNGTYTYTVLNTGEVFSGQYSYQVVSPSIGVVDAQETFSGQLTRYSMTLLCENMGSGRYVYRQQVGVDGARVNVARYFLMQPVPAK